MYQTNINQKKAEMVILVFNKVGFRAKKITRDREGHYIIIKGQSTKMYAPNNKTVKYVKQNLIAEKRHRTDPQVKLKSSVTDRTTR